MAGGLADFFAHPLNIALIVAIVIGYFLIASKRKR